MKRVAHLFLLIALLLPLAAEGAVRISEVAWMGTQESANDEWIELYNDGTADVDLQGWRLATDDGGIDVALAGTIPAGGYFLLERTDDASVPSVPADMLYAGSLSNEGEVLRLFRADGTEADKVDGGDAWAVGGDNATKETLQRKGDVWVTAPPTPKAGYAPNAEENAQNGQESGEQDQTKEAGTLEGEDASASRNRPVLLKDVVPILSVAIDAPARAAPGARVSFRAVVYDQEGKEVRAPVRIFWNFGDGTVGEGREAAHLYRYPGEYVVRVRAVWDRFGTELTAEARRTLTVTALDLVLPSYGRDYTDIANREAFEVDLSGWTLVRGGAVLRIPALTTLLPGRTLRLRHAPTRMAPPLLFDAEKNIAAAFAPPRPPARAPSARHTPVAREGRSATARAAAAAPPRTAARAAPAPSAPLAAQSIAAPRQFAASTSLAVQAAAAASPAVRAGAGAAIWYWALAGLVALGVFAALMRVPGHPAPAPRGDTTDAALSPEAALPPAEAFTLVEEGEKRG